MLGLSGSLREASTNTALLRAAAAGAPPRIVLSLYEGVGTLPIFNPDLDRPPEPPAVLRLRQEVRAADGLVIACPEYAHGVPGGLKNALDWLVSGSEIPGKPVALFHASARSAHARAALVDVLRTMSAVVLSEFTLPLLGKELRECERVLSRSDTIAGLSTALEDFAAGIVRSWIVP